MLPEAEALKHGATFERKAGSPFVSNLNVPLLTKSYFMPG